MLEAREESGGVRVSVRASTAAGAVRNGGLFGMLSFVALVAGVGGANDALRTVALVDVAAALALAAGLLLDRRTRGDSPDAVLDRRTRDD